MTPEEVTEYDNQRQNQTTKMNTARTSAKKLANVKPPSGMDTSLDKQSAHSSFSNKEPRHF